MYNKGKCKESIVQDEEVLLYKLYTILSSSEPSRPLTLEPILLKEVNYLEKVLKTLQSPIKTIPFLSLVYYKPI